MSGTKISALVAAGVLTGTEILAGVQGGGNVGITANQIKTFIGSGLTIGSTAIAGGASSRLLYDNAGVVGEITGATSNGTALTLVAPVLGTPASGNLSNCTAYPIASVANLAAGIATFLTTPTSANLAAAITDETGTGPAVFASAPTFTTTIQLGTVSSATGQIKLAHASSANLTTLQAGNAVAARTYTWPTDFGAAGVVLTDAAGNGTLSWAVPSSGLTIGTTSIASGTGTRLLYETAGNKVGEISGATSDGTTLTMVAPVLGTPASGTLTNCTGLPAAGVVGTAAILGLNTFTRLQTITQGTANEGVIASTGYSLTGANATNMVDLAGTWNTSGAPTALKVAITNTASSGSSFLVNLLSGGAGTTSRFNVTVGGFVQFDNAQDNASGGGSWAISNGQGKFGPLTVINGLDLRWDSGAGNGDIFLSRKGAANLQIGTADAASPVAQKLTVQSVVAGNANTAGVNTTVALSSLSNGSGLSGDTIFQTGDTGVAAGSQNALVTALTLKGGTAQGKSGSVVIGSAALATTATDGFLYIPGGAGAPSGVPTAFSGRVALYYDTTNNKFYVYNAAWKGGTAPGAWS